MKKIRQGACRAVDKVDDIRNNFEEQRKKIDERLGDTPMPVDTKGRVIAFVVLGIVLVTIWFMLDIAIVTFILTFVFYHLHKYALRGLSKTFLRIIPDGIVLVLIYVGVILLFVGFLQHNIPIIISQIQDIAFAFVGFDLQKFITEIDPNLKFLAQQLDMNEYIWRVGQAILGGIAGIGQVALNFLIALVLSFLFVLEREKIMMIGDSVKGSRIAYVYRYFLMFAGSFCYTFGKVMKVQVIIAAINCAISTTYLMIAGFPYVMVLSIMIFILGLIPVAGVFISLVPLTIIAFTSGGIAKVIEVLIMIAIIHIIEAYFLNPKLMSRRTSLPVSLVFLVLIISEKYLGAWGMLIGVPFFIYVLNVLNIDYRRAMEEEFMWKTKADIDKSNGSKKPRKKFREVFKLRKSVNEEKPDGEEKSVSEEKKE